MVGLSDTKDPSTRQQEVHSSHLHRVGIFGGTFDPIHIGHMILAQEALSQLNLDNVIWVLTPRSPHKTIQQLTDVQLRLELLKTALQDNPQFRISYADINRPPPHYAVDTLHQIKLEYPASQIVYLLGGDSLSDLPTWHNPQKLLLLVDELGVMRRPGYSHQLDELEIKLPGIREKIRWIEAPQMDVSSSKIRGKIKTGQAFRYYLYPAVYSKICEIGLYQEDKDSSSVS